MKHLPIIFGITASAASPAWAAFPLSFDDFAGGPHVANLISVTPPQIALDSFAYAGAIGGFRDVVVISETPGIFSAGVQLDRGGYASFNGRGRGGVVYDGVAGISDKNADGNITAADLDYGLNFDLDVEDCPAITLHVRAFADLPNADLNIVFATGADDLIQFVIPLTTVGAFADYYVDFFNPTIEVGSFDPTDLNAVAFFHEGGDFANLDIYVNQFDLNCVPESSTWLAMGTLGGLLGLGWLRRHRA